MTTGVTRELVEDPSCSRNSTII